MIPDKKMSSKLFLTLLAIGFNAAAFPQGFVQCGSRKVPYENNYNDHFEMVIHSPYEEVDTSAIPKKIMENSSEYLYYRAGPEFYGQLVFYCAQVVDFKKYKQIKKERPFVDEKLADKRVKYCLQYYFNLQGLKYYFTLVYDEDGFRLSDNFVPERATNRIFDRTIDICLATYIAETDTVFPGPIKSMRLEYLPSKNTFAWIARKETVPKGETTPVTRFLIIDANRGQILNRQEVKGTGPCKLSGF